MHVMLQFNLEIIKNAMLSELKFLFSLFCFGLMASFAPVVGQNDGLRYYSVEDGLSNNTVKTICQDENGYIWVGTKNGLNRLDGYEIKNYYHLPTSEVETPNDITCVNRFSDGLFWIGTFSGIVLFDPLKEEYLDLSERYSGTEFPSSVVVGCYEDPSGNCWVGTKQGLYMFGKDGRCISVDVFHNAYIHMMTVADDYMLLMDVVGQGIVLYDLQSMQSRVLLKTGKRFSLTDGFRDSKGRIWLVEDLEKLYRYIPDSEEVLSVNCMTEPGIVLERNYVHDIIELNDSTLLFATDKGLVAYNVDRSIFYRQINGSVTIDKRLMTVFKDKQGGIWFGTFGQGVIYYHPQLFVFVHHLSSETGQQLSDFQVVRSLVEAQNCLWVGYTNGMRIMDLGNPSFSEDIHWRDMVSLEFDSELYYVYQNSPTELYLYFLNLGIYSFDMVKRTLVKTDIPVSSVDEQIRSMERDTMGRLWIAEDDLSVWNAKKHLLDKNLSTNYKGITRYMLTQDILRHGDNMIVGARTNGVWVFKPCEQNDSVYFKGECAEFEELKNKNVSLLYEDSGENVWVGTYDMGVFKCNFEKHKIWHFDTDNGLVHNSVCGIVEDKNSHDIWIAAINGLSQIKSDSLIVNFTSRNGFPLNEVSHKALIQAQNGHIYVGGNNGVAEIDPTELPYSGNMPNTVLISLVETLNSKKSGNHLTFNNLQSRNKVVLPYDNSSIRIKYSALDFISPQSYRYAYQLKGLDEEWHYIDNNEVIYSNLPAGKYVFAVKACSNEGIWGTEATIAVRVYPAPWASWWAKSFYVFLIVFFVVILIRYLYEKKTAKYKQQIARMEKEAIEKNYRMRIELFTNFSHELRTPLTLITGPVDDIVAGGKLPTDLRYPMKLIQKNANKLLLLVNQLMDFRKLEQGVMQLRLSCLEIEPFVQEQIDNFSDLLNRYQLTISYSNDYHGDDLWVDADLMSKVLFNLISNAVKHSPSGGKIDISTVQDGNSIVLSVQDHGVGIAKEHQQHIFEPFYQTDNKGRIELFGSGIGLNLVRYVMKLHAGDLWLESTLGQGSTFFIRLLLGKEHFAGSNVVYTDQMDNSTLKVERNSVLSVGLEKKEVEDEPENRLKLLIVEDDEDMRLYISTMLSEFYQVTVAQDGKAGIEKARELVPDLIISDVMMPFVDGVELCRLVKNDMTLGHIPFILLTAKSLVEHIEEGYQALADDYVLKPFDMHILHAKIESLLKNREQLQKILATKVQAADVPVNEISEENPFMEKLIELITQNIKNPELSAELLYTTLGMSRTQFFRKIKGISDLSPNKLIVNIRMKMAVEKLRGRDMSISEVAYEVGFSEPAYFSKVFKSVYGQTPTEFIRTM